MPDAPNSGDNSKLKDTDAPAKVSANVQSKEPGQPQLLTPTQEAFAAGNATGKRVAPPALISASDNVKRLYAWANPAVAPDVNGGVSQPPARSFTAIASSAIIDVSRNAGLQLAKHILAAYPDPHVNLGPIAPRASRSVSEESVSSEEPESSEESTKTEQQLLRAAISVLRAQSAQKIRALTAAFLHTSDVQPPQSLPGPWRTVSRTEMTNVERNSDARPEENTLTPCPRCATNCANAAPQVSHVKPTEPTSDDKPGDAEVPPNTGKSEGLKRKTQQKTTGSRSKRPRSDPRAA